jgi:AcrR family transcriptional regulator
MAERGRPRSFDRTEALSAAMTLFWTKGYEATTMADLTAAMGVASPSLYAAFGSKEELYLEAFERYEAVEGAEIGGALREGPTAREAIAGYLSASATAFSRKGRPPGCMIVLSALAAEGASETIRADLKLRRAAAVGEIEARLRRSADSGEIPRTVDFATVARFFTTVQQGMSIQARDGASRSELQAIADSAMASWDRLVAG